MADLTYIEKNQIEEFLGMKTGLVLDFNNLSFREFIMEITGCDIESEKYNNRTNSKANRLRAFFKIESNSVVGKLIKAFYNYQISQIQIGKIEFHRSEEGLYNTLDAIAERLSTHNIIENLDAITPNSDEKDFNLLAKNIRESLERNEPESALDRLHTFTIKFIRELCNKHNIKFEKSESLNGIFGKYIKYLKSNNFIDSEMSEKILKYSINILEAFNDIRNNKSFAHDNPILNHQESILIFENVTSAIKFINHIEEKIDKLETDDLPF